MNKYEAKRRATRKVAMVQSIFVSFGIKSLSNEGIGSLSNHDDERKTTNGSNGNVIAQARTKNFAVVLSSTTLEGSVSRRRELPNSKAVSLIKRCLFIFFFLQSMSGWSSYSLLRLI